MSPPKQKPLLCLAVQIFTGFSGQFWHKLQILKLQGSDQLHTLCIRPLLWPLCTLFSTWVPLPRFQILTTLEQEFQHSVPNTVLHSAQTLEDVVEFFSTEVRTSSPLEDLASLDLPPNLSIQTEYTRFNPNNPDDPLTGGRTAFPGSNTYVTSIKYKRKYDDIITTKPKPGYVNHYEEY